MRVAFDRRDQIIFPLAADIRQPQAGDPLRSTVQHSAHHLVGGGPALVDLSAGMAPQQAVQLDDIALFTLKGAAFPRQEAVQPHAAGAGDGEDPLLL